MRNLWFYVALVPTLTILHVYCESDYDAATCGLPGPKYVKPRWGRGVWGQRRPALTGASKPQKNRDHSDGDRHGGYVMGGVKVDLDELPWTALIQTTDGKQVCGGTLVSKRHVITAAHCFWKNNKRSPHCTTDDMYTKEEALEITKVMVGGICWQPGNQGSCTKAEAGKWMSVESAYYEPFFKHGCAGTYDIAFLKLSEAIPDGIHHVCLQHLHNTDELYKSPPKLLSAGFGADPLHGHIEFPSPWLQEVVLGVKMPDEECDDFMPGRKPDTMCTYEQSQRNVCHGDSGGGVTALLNDRHYLLGLVSFGTACDELVKGARPEAQVHTNIAYYTADIDTFLDMKVEDRKETWEKVKKH